MGMKRPYWRTFRKETSVSIRKVPSKKPSIAEFVVSFDQLNAIIFRQAQLIGASGLKIVY
jgi:hypothetical protein